MSSRGGTSNNGGGIQSISAASRKMVQSLKEIVNCPEQEIYAMLKECNMDPNEAVNRLLSQDPFHEVKRKREKKKENKDTTESRSRGVSISSNRGSRGAADCYAGRGGSAHFSVSESGSLHGKPTPKKESGNNSYASFSSPASGIAGTNVNQRPPTLSDSVTAENERVDGISLSSQLSSGYQSAWVGVPGLVSMADIVKMGRPHGKASITPNPSYQSVNHHNVQAPPSTMSHHDLRSSEDYASKASVIKSEPGVGMGRHVSFNNEWPLVEQPPAVNVPSVLEPPAVSELHGDLSNFPFDRINQNPESQVDEVRAAVDATVENLNATRVGSASVSGRKMQEDNSGGASLFDDDMYKNMGSYQPHKHAFEHQEVEDGGSVTSVTTNLQQFNIQEEDQVAPPEEDNPSVVIPNHLQVQTADCLHLSFGSFESAAFSGSFASRPPMSNLEEESADADTSSIGHSDTRNPEYYGDEPLRIVSDGNLAHRTGETSVSYDSPSASQPEMLKQENPEATHGNQYAIPSSTPGYTFENGQQLNTAFSHSHMNSQIQNLAPFSSVMAYTDSLPSTLLAAPVQPMREADLPYSPFPVTQAMPTKFGNSASSLSVSTISMPEALKPDNFLPAQLTAQTLPGTSIATGPALPQHLAMHPYSQPSLPLGPFANMIGYPFLPQSYTYMPSAFQQAFAGNNIYHQSLAAVLPQYKNSVSASSLPQSAAIASGYGAFGSSTSIPGNFPVNSPTAPPGTTMGYDDIISTQYKDGSHLISPQQNDSLAMWMHGSRSRTMSVLPANTYYNLEGQNQQPAGFQQGQHPSQNYGASGYSNFYQTGISLEHQHQNPRDGSLSGSHGQPSKQSQQLWQNSY